MKPIIFLLLGLVILGGLFFAFKSQTQPAASESVVASPQTKVFELVVKNRKLVSGPETLSVTEGDSVTIKITVDEDEELHLHGYDTSVDLTKGEPAELSFTAVLTGRFPYELENSKTDIGTLEVTPK